MVYDWHAPGITQLSLTILWIEYVGLSISNFSADDVALCQLVPCFRT
jgi:hypothetical protein